MLGPGSFSTMKQVMPSGVLAASATTPARSPLVTHIFVPSMMYSSPSGVALQRSACGVAAGVGLGQRERRPLLAGGHPRQQPLALLVGAVPRDERGGDRVGVEHAGERHPAGRQLLDEPGVGDGVEVEAAVLLGDAAAEQPEGLHLLDQRLRVLVGVLELRGDGQHVLLDERADGGDELVGREPGSVAVVMVADCMTSHIGSAAKRPERGMYDAFDRGAHCDRDHRFPRNRGQSLGASAQQSSSWSPATR